MPDAASTVLEAEACLTVALGGLSKSVGLPQLKLGWMALGGPPPLVAAALDRLEIVADTYLSVSTPVQVAAPDLLERGAALRAAITDRVLLNDAALRRAAAAHPSCTVLPVEAGWTAVVRVPAVVDDEALAMTLLERADVLVHPGYFFDFAREGFLVVSLLVEPGRVRRGRRTHVRRDRRRHPHAPSGRTSPPAGRPATSWRSDLRPIAPGLPLH